MIHISQKSPAIGHAEQTYKHNQTRITPVKENTANEVNSATAGNQTVNRKITAPSEILSSRETETLRALFGIQNPVENFYGNTKLQSVNRGFLLDIKG